MAVEVKFLKTETITRNTALLLSTLMEGSDLHFARNKLSYKDRLLPLCSFGSLLSCSSNRIRYVCVIWVVEFDLFVIMTCVRTFWPETVTRFQKGTNTTPLHQLFRVRYCCLGGSFRLGGEPAYYTMLQKQIWIEA